MSYFFEKRYQFIFCIMFGALFFSGCSSIAIDNKLKSLGRSAERIMYVYTHSPQTKKKLKELDQRLDILENELAQRIFIREKIIKDQRMFFESNFAIEQSSSERGKVFQNARETAILNLNKKIMIDQEIESLNYEIETFRTMYKQTGEYP